MNALDIIALPGHPGMFARRVAVEAWQSAGSPHVNSAGRLYAEQKRLWDGWRKRLPGFNPADNPDDESQRLAHCRFVAFDIDPTADRIRRLSAAGLARPYPYEPWHWELPNVRSYGIVRSVATTASIRPTPIIPTIPTIPPTKEFEMPLLRIAANGSAGLFYDDRYKPLTGDQAIWAYAQFVPLPHPMNGTLPDWKAAGLIISNEQFDGMINLCNEQKAAREAGIVAALRAAGITSTPK